MQLTKEYIAECEDCVFRNYKQIDGDRKSQRVQERIKIIKDFCRKSKTILSVGCGPYEPIDLNATHACDVAPNAKKYLRLHGWKGMFWIASCDLLPFRARQFDVAVCSEVIEHLPDLGIVKKTFQQVNLVAKRWIFTCPDWLGTEITHKRAFNEITLRAVTSGLKCEIKHIGRYWYVLHDRN
ncbi:hypothetical protein ES703_124905 [subsurface metagenome]